MSRIASSSEGRRGSGEAESSTQLSRTDLAALVAAERRLSGALARPAEVLRFLLLAVEETGSLLHVDRAMLCLVDSEDPRVLRVMAGLGAMAEEEGELLPVDGSFEGRVFRSAVPVRSRDLASEPEGYIPRRNPRRGGPAVAVPLRIRNQPIGVLLAGREPGGAPFLERDAELLREFATPVTAAIESMRQFDASRRSREAVDAWQREQDLQRWIGRYEAITALRVELVFRLDVSGRLDWGGSTEPLFGIAPDEFAPRIEDFLYRVSSEDREEAGRALHSLINPAGPPSISVSCGMILRDGSIQKARLKGWRVRDRDEILGVLTPAVRAETPVEEGESAPAAAETALETVVRSLRHQINNPLAAVIGRAQLMIREEIVQREPTLRQSVETILYESERINRFVQQLQDLDGLSRLNEPLPGETTPARW